MKTSTVWKSFTSADQTLALSHTYRNGVYYHLILTVENAIYAEHIKDICVQEVHPFFEELSSEFIDTEMIERLLETSMQQLNHNLSLFAEQAQVTSPILIHGALLVSYHGTIITSLIGQSSLIVCREDKAIYSMANSDQAKKMIDHFTDYITGDIHQGDSILFVGYDHTLMFHQKELDEIAHIIYENDEDMLMVLETMMTQRVSADELGFMSLVSHVSTTVHIPGLAKGANMMSKFSRGPLAQITQSVSNYVVDHKYMVSIVLLGVFVLYSIGSIISNILQTSTDVPTIVTEDGSTQPVTIEEVKKTIAEFQDMDPSSELKGKKYQEITQSLAFLESKGKWLEDVKQLKKIVQKKYYEGFRIVPISQLDDPTGEFQTSYTFSDYESKIIGLPINIYYQKGFSVGGTKGALLTAISNDVKGTAVSYSLETTMKKCSKDLSRGGLYCFDDRNEIYRISPGSVQPIQANENVSLPTDIQDIGVFAKNNMYLLINPTSNGGVDVIKRLKNEPGSFSVFRESIGYYAVDGSGNAGDYTSMAIDGTFLLWSPSKKALFQLWRDGVTMYRRQVPMVGGETSMTAYSANVRIITSDTSPYIYLWDSTQQTFTVYSSKPLKTNAANATPTYTLSYVMRYAFDLTNKVIDVAVPESSGDKPLIYAMTTKGIYQADLGQTIAAFAKTQ